MRYVIPDLIGFWCVLKIFGEMEDRSTKIPMPSNILIIGYLWNSAIMCSYPINIEHDVKNQRCIMGVSRPFRPSPHFLGNETTRG
jgi:hypothetical protein